MFPGQGTAIAEGYSRGLSLGQTLTESESKWPLQSKASHREVTPMPAKVDHSDIYWSLMMSVTGGHFES